jgi:2-polyprenyl-3-methyl-5-hydroxy-6-metoxy-1,4-benzoquinol methylase
MPAHSMLFFIRSIAVLALLMFATGGLMAADTAPAKSNHPGYTKKDTPSRGGTGKVYMGREISHVMGHLGAGWLERKTREDEEKPATLMKALTLKKGDKVADIGCGSGYFTRRLAKEIGPQGTVYAVDIQPEMLTILDAKMAEAGVANYKPVLGTISDPKLPAKTIDLVLFVDVYHEFSHPFEMMDNICKALKKGGRVVWVEYRKEDPKVPIKLLHKMSEAQVKKEAEAHALEYVETIGVLPRQHIIIFKKK